VAQLVVRNIEEDLKERLRRRAKKKHGRSMEEEMREILRNALKDGDRRQEGLGTRLARRFRGIGLDFDIPELRGQEPRPARFEE
jgi:antitoxin FitA